MDNQDQEIKALIRSADRVQRNSFRRTVIYTVLVVFAAGMLIWVAGTANWSTSKRVDSVIKEVDSLRGGLEARLERPMVAGFVVNGEKPQTTESAQLGDRVTVKIVLDPESYDIKKPRARASAILGFSDDEIHRIVPYLNGLSLNGVYPEVIDPVSQTLQFHLVWTPDSKDTWKSILGSPTVKPRQVTFSVGVEGKYQIESVIHAFYITILRPTYVLISLIFLLLSFAVFLCLAIKTAILKDPPDPTQPEDSTYSLARVQMAVWFFVVIVSFLLIWVTTGNFDTITSSTLVLIGISATTAVGEKLISPNGSPATPGLKGPRRFILDILTEDGRIAFDRLQILVLTLVLVFAFLKSVLVDFQLPQFDIGVLALMGISAGTYLGFQAAESKSRWRAGGNAA